MRKELDRNWRQRKEVSPFHSFFETHNSVMGRNELGQRRGQKMSLQECAGVFTGLGTHLGVKAGKQGVDGTL